MATETPAVRPARNRARLVVIAILAVLCLVVFFQNLQTATVRLLFFSVSMNTIVLMLVMTFIGFVLGWLVATMKKEKKPATGGDPQR